MKNKAFRSRCRHWNGDLERVHFLLNVFCVLAVPVGSARTGESCKPPRRVHAVLADGHRKIPWGVEPVGRALAAEFRRMDVELVWSTEDDAGEEIVIFVNILPHPPADWGLSTKALGVVRRDERGSSPVFVFYPSIERVLGVPGRADRISDEDIPPAKWVLGLARIIAHEILHVLLPGKPHDRIGIFASDLRPHALIARKLDLEEQTRAALAERLCDGQALGR